MRPVLATLVLASLLLVPGAQAEPVPQPRLSVGDLWEYAGTARSAGDETNVTMRVEVVDATEDVLILRSYTVSRSGQTHVTFSDSVSVHRASDLALLETQARTQSRRGAQTSNANVTTSFAAPCVERVFPFEVGSSWGVECVGWTNGTIDFRNVNLSADRNERVSVGANATVSFPSGSAEAYELSSKSAAGSVINASYAPAVCRDVAVRTSHRGVVSELRLTAWICQAARTSGGSPTLVFPDAWEGDRVKIPDRGIPTPALAALLGALVIAALAYRRPKGS